MKIYLAKLATYIYANILKIKRNLRNHKLNLNAYEISLLLLQAKNF